VEVEVSLYVGVRIVEAMVHHGDGFSHGSEQLFING
jgi:hypothetical protein